MNQTILIADDDINIIASLKFVLADEGYNVVAVTTPDAAIAAVNEQQIDLVLLDMNFHADTTSGAEGVKLVKDIKQLDELIPVIVMTGWATVDLAVEAMQAGAKDVIQKPWDNDRVITAIDNQLTLASTQRASRRLSQQNKLLVSQAHPANRSGIIAQSAVMQELLATLDELAQSDMSILLTGDNGTGKSMLAAYVHQASSRANNAFVSVNMGAIPESLFESEMFGHKKGAFTDAKENRVGRFEMAQSGTLFLDELANIPIAQQAKLLRVLEEKKYEVVGSSKQYTADVRVISATNGNLVKAIENGQFRQDLYYRLNTVELRIPSLSERLEDVPQLAQHFLNLHSAKYNKPCPAISSSAIDAMQGYHWPGNIRELSHLLERVLFTSKGATIEAADLALPNNESTVVMSDNINLTLDEIEQQSLMLRLKHHKGNATATAKSLGLSRSGFYRRLHKFGIDV